jgi:hypothetical protein
MPNFPGVDPALSKKAQAAWEESPSLQDEYPTVEQYVYWCHGLRLDEVGRIKLTHDSSLPKSAEPKKLPRLMDIYRTDVLEPLYGLWPPVWLYGPWPLVWLHDRPEFVSDVDPWNGWRPETSDADALPHEFREAFLAFVEARHGSNELPLVGKLEPFSQAVRWAKLSPLIWRESIRVNLLESYIELRSPPQNGWRLYAEELVAVPRESVPWHVKTLNAAMAPTTAVETPDDSEIAEVLRVESEWAELARTMQAEDFFWKVPIPAFIERHSVFTKVKTREDFYGCIKRITGIPTGTSRTYYNRGAGHDSHKKCQLIFDDLRKRRT